MEMPLKSKTYAILGEIAVNFSNIEFIMTEILVTLVDGCPHSIAGALTVDGFPMHKTLTSIRRLARFRYCHLPARLGQVEDLCKAVDEVRKERNRFIHGKWLIEPDLFGGEVCVVDTRWKDKAKQWTRWEETRIGLDQLSDLKCQTSRLASRAVSLLKGLDPEEMAPRWQIANGKIAPSDVAGQNGIAAKPSSPIQESPKSSCGD
jgi:hypothetical protein